MQLFKTPHIRFLKYRYVALAVTAVIILAGLLNIVLGRRPPGDPTDPAIRHIEGWILGQLDNKKRRTK